MSHPDADTWNGMSGTITTNAKYTYNCSDGTCNWCSDCSSSWPHPCLCVVDSGSASPYYCGDGNCADSEQSWCRFDCNDEEIVEPLIVGGCTPACAGDETCQSGVCVNDTSGCTPSCGANECGSDGCGGSCGTCAAGETCNASFACESAASGHICDDNCGTQLPSGCFCGFNCKGFNDCCNADGDAYSSDCAGSTCAACN